MLETPDISSSMREYELIELYSYTIYTFMEKYGDFSSNLTLPTQIEIKINFAEILTFACCALTFDGPYPYLLSV